VLTYVRRSDHEEAFTLTEDPKPDRPQPQYRMPSEDRLHLGSRARDIGLVVLAVIALVLAVLAVKYARHGPGTTAGAVAVISSPSASPSATPTATTKAVTLARAKSVLAKKSPVVISVLGDSTGDEEGEWVDLWANKLGDSRQVTVHRWDPDTNDWLQGPATYGTHGPRVTIWNGSQPGAKASSPATELKAMTPGKADMVIYSFGHDDTAGTITKGLTATADAVAKRWAGIPTVVIRQNPESNQHRAAQDRTLAAVSRWAKQSRTPTIDVTKAFHQSSEDVASLTKDDGNPNAIGSQLWADAVAAALR